MANLEAFDFDVEARLVLFGRFGRSWTVPMIDSAGCATALEGEDGGAGRRCCDGGDGGAWTLSLTTLVVEVNRTLFAADVEPTSLDEEPMVASLPGCVV